MKFHQTPLSALPALALTAAIITTACQADANSSTDPFAADPWTLSDREARIGSVDDPDYIFNPILRMALGPDGLLYTAHGGEATIRKWTADGAPAGSLGRRGEGPGEFQVPYQVGFFGDSLWVWDFARARVSYFDLQGEFLGSVAAKADVSWDVSPVRPIAPLRDGTFMWMRLPFFSPGPGAPKEIPFARIDADGRRLALIWAQPWEPHDADGQSFGDAHLSGLGRRGLLVVDRRVWTGEGEATVRVSEIGFDGDTIFTAAVPYDPVPLTDERFDSGVRTAARGSSSEAQLRESMYRPPYLPAVGHVIGAEDGTIWLRRFDPVELETGEEVFEWWVLDGEGAPLARARTPVGLDVRLITDDMVWGLERDELDVEYIVRHRLMKDG